MTEDQYQHLLSIIEDNSGKLDRIDAKLKEHDGHFLRIDEKLHEYAARFEVLDESLGLVLRKVGDLDTRLDGFISLMKGSPLWRMMKVLES